MKKNVESPAHGTPFKTETQAAEEKKGKTQEEDTFKNEMMQHLENKVKETCKFFFFSKNVLNLSMILIISPYSTCHKF